ncbi:MAG: phosphoenolpyruvate carboxykinase domain-containing protein, partial [Pseudomonadota bacterium]
TNVATTADNEPWWEDKKVGEPVTDWRGNRFEPDNGPAAHPNSRFTVAATQNPSYTSLAEAPEGVPISAIVFGGRRKELAPLVYEARDWRHGVLVGAGVGSETTAAATGERGIVRRDPMAMQPFCGYNFGDYWRHWLNVGSALTNTPRVFHVNWFRQDGDGRFLWPGFGENLRVLRWMIDRCEGRVGAQQSPIGLLPHASDIDVADLDIQDDSMAALMSIDPSDWLTEMEAISSYLDSYGQRLPQPLRDECDRVLGELREAS